MKPKLLAAFTCASLISFPARSAVVPDQAQADLILGRQLPTATNLVAPRVAVDPATQKVFVSDERFHRILRFGADADGLLGQPDFGFAGNGLGPGQFFSPRTIVRDPSGCLWVADMNNERVLRFSPVTLRLALAQKNPTTLAFTCANVVKNVQYAWQSTTKFQTWQTDGTLTPTLTGTVTHEMPKPADSMRAYRLMEQ